MRSSAVTPIYYYSKCFPSRVRLLKPRKSTMFKIYRDKIKTFECNVSVEGADLSSAQARLVLENNEYSLLFPGNINLDGKCTIDIGQLRFLSEDLKGKMKLEVIVDGDTYFVPYEDDFIIDTSKKVRVEVLSETINKGPTKVVVEVKETDTPETKDAPTPPSRKLQNMKPAVTEAYHMLIKENIQALKPHLKKYIVKRILNEVSSTYKIRPENINRFNSLVLKEVKKSNSNG
jgi:hypothetical protein